MDLERTKREEPWKHALQEFRPKIADAIEANITPDRFGDLLVGNRFITEQAKRDKVNGTEKNYTKVTSLLDAVSTDINYAGSKGRSTQRFNDFVAILETLGFTDNIAQQLTQCYCQCDPGYVPPTTDPATAEHQAQATHAPPPVARIEPAPAAAQGELQTADNNQQNSVLQSSQQKHSQHAAAQLTGIQMLYDIEDATGDTRKTYTVESWKMPKSTKVKAARPVIMAILDSGINNDHKAFDASDRIIPIKLPGQSDTNDETGHGTLCAGIAAGMPYEEIRQGFFSRCLGKTDKFPGGVAPNYRLIVYKVTTAEGNYEGLVPALIDLRTLTAAKVGMGGKTGPLIDVVSMSFGSTEENPNITDAINLLSAKETICVAAAGNDGGLTDKCPFPAKYDNVIAVGACTDSGDRWKYTTRATDKRVYLAPGVDILAPSHGSTTELVARSGTSLAAPAVAGLIAQLIDWTYAYFSPEAARQIHNTENMKKVLDLMVNNHGILQPNKVLSADLFKKKVKTCFPSNLD